MIKLLMVLFIASPLIAADVSENMEKINRSSSSIHLDLSNQEDIEDIKFIEQFKNLKTLDLENCDRIKDFSPLQFLTSLEELNLAWTDCKDYSFIPSLKNLTLLIVSSDCFDPFDVGHNPSIKMLSVKGYLSSKEKEHVKEIFPNAEIEEG